MKWTMLHFVCCMSSLLHTCDLHLAHSADEHPAQVAVCAPSAAWTPPVIAVPCSMADLGMNIITVIHQPRYSIFRLFHEVLLLGTSGRTVYLGPSEAALGWFQSLGFRLPPNENPADFCLDVISGSIPCDGKADFTPEVGLQL